MRHRMTHSALIALAIAAASGSIGRLDAGQTPTPGTLITVAGTGTTGDAGDGGPATQAQLNDSRRIVVDAAGGLFIAESDGNRVRKVSPDGIISTVAGTGKAGFSGDNGLATQAQLNQPNAVALDANGVLYIADTGNNRVRKVTADGIITTIAGTGKVGFSGDGGPATQAELNIPTGMVVDSAGNLLIANFGSGTVRRISPDGMITTVAGTGKRGKAIDGQAATATQLDSPDSVALDEAGNLYIADRQVNQVRKVSLDGTITTVAGTGEEGFAGDGGPATQAQLDGPHDLTVDQAGSMFIADLYNHRIRKVSADGMIATVAGGGSDAPGFGENGPALDATLGPVMGVAVDAHGNLFIAVTGFFDPSLKGLSERALEVFAAAAPGLLAGRPIVSP